MSLVTVEEEQGIDTMYEQGNAVFAIHFIVKAL